MFAIILDDGTHTIFAGLILFLSPSFHRCHRIPLSLSLLFCSSSSSLSRITSALVALMFRSGFYICTCRLVLVHMNITRLAYSTSSAVSVTDRTVAIQRSHQAFSRLFSSHKRQIRFGLRCFVLETR